MKKDFIEVCLELPHEKGLKNIFINRNHIVSINRETKENEEVYFTINFSNGKKIIIEEKENYNFMLWFDSLGKEGKGIEW